VGFFDRSVLCFGKDEFGRAGIPAGLFCDKSISGFENS
jgi:hypothetical protein